MENQWTQLSDTEKSNLGRSEQLVFSSIINVIFTEGTTDIAQIAKLCNLSELQVLVSIQLLLHKQLLSPEDFLNLSFNNSLS